MYYTGGISAGKTTNDVIAVNTLNLVVSMLRGMQQARAAHAVLMHNENLYVFGGFGDRDMTFALSTCEVYRNDRWDIIIMP
jgi:N-acetylneuraminic acid mutarotase